MAACISCPPHTHFFMLSYSELTFLACFSVPPCFSQLVNSMRAESVLYILGQCCFLSILHSAKHSKCSINLLTESVIVLPEFCFDLCTVPIYILCFIFLCLCLIISSVCVSVLPDSNWMRHCLFNQSFPCPEQNSSCDQGF